MITYYVILWRTYVFRPSNFRYMCYEVLYYEIKQSQFNSFTNIKTMTTKNNFTFCWSSKANGGESVRPGIFTIDVVDDEWWILHAHFNVNPSSSFRVYFNSIFIPKNKLHWRIWVDCRNFTHQSDWTIFIISFVICQNIWWS